MLTRLRRLVRRLVRAPVFEEDAEKTRNAALLNIILWTMVGAILLAAPFLVLGSEDATGQLLTAVLLGIFVLPILGLRSLLRQGRVELASVLLSSLILFASTAAIFVFGGIRNTVVPGYMLAIFVAGLLMGAKMACLFGLLSVLATSGIFLAELHQVSVLGLDIPVLPLARVVDYDDLFMLFAIFSVTTVIVSLARRSIVRALGRAQRDERALSESYRELQVRKDELQARTHMLERRTEQLRAAAQVAREAATIRHLGKLLDRAVNLIEERFGFYHTAIYLVDDIGESVLLRAATGRIGRQMLEREHEIKFGERSLVAHVIDSGHHSIALDSDPALELDDSFLPQTRSEIALPLQTGRDVIGALDVHSRRENAFDEDDVAVLQIMADQLAAAIQNARLLTEMEQTVRELEAASGRYTRESWQMSARRMEGPWGYRYHRLGIEPVSTHTPEARRAWLENRPVIETTEHGGDRGAVSDLAVPVRLRDRVVGVLNLRFKESSPSQDTVSLVEQIADRLALAMENARLLEEAQRRAEQDRLVTDVTARVRASMNMERILQAAVRELGAALGTERAFIRLGPGAQPFESDEDSSGEQQ